MVAEYTTKDKSSYQKPTTPRALITPSTVDLAWAAGFLEGEGSFIATKHAKSHMVSAPQMHREPLDRLAKYFGGTVAIRAKSHTPFAWQIYGARARGVMMTLYSFMTVKRKQQILSALEVW